MNTLLGRALVMAGALLGCSLLSPAAVANGRFPASQLLLSDPSDPNRLWLRTTYGLLISNDRGCTWHFICEAALGYKGLEDPMYGVLADGSVIGGLFNGLITSRDRGCDWSLAGPMEGLYVVDLAVQKDDAARAVALVSVGGPTNWSFRNEVWKTVDSAKTWSKLGSALPADAVLLTLDTAPSDPSRIYVTGLRPVTTDAGASAGPDAAVASAVEGVLFRSEDAGMTWQASPIPGSSNGFDPYLSAVHPLDSEKLYVRLRGPDSGAVVVDRVVYSADSGRNWQLIYEARADILGFAISPDGSRILLGLGDSKTATRPVDQGVLGLYAASTSDYRFERKRGGHIGCLTWSAEGVYFCGSEFNGGGGPGPGFELGLSTDEGASNKQLMHLASVEGPVQCASGTSTAHSCSDESEWKRLCETIGRCDSNGNTLAYPRGETCTAGTAGAAGAAGSGGAGNAPDGGPQANSDEDLRIRGGCGLAMFDSQSEYATISLLALAALANLRRTRRKAKR